MGRVEDRLRLSLGIGLSVAAPFVWRCLNSRSMDSITNPPSSNRAYGFPVHGFPMFFMPGHAPSSRQPSLEAYTGHNVHTALDSETCLARLFGLSPYDAYADVRDFGVIGVIGLVSRMMPTDPLAPA